MARTHVSGSNCVEARSAIEAIMTEVRGHLRVVDLNNPKAAIARFEKNRLLNVGISSDKRRLRDKLILANAPIASIAKRIGVSTTAIYKARNVLLPKKT